MSVESAEVAAASECSLLFFEVGGQVFAADPLDVLRIDRPRPDLPFAELIASSAGRVVVGRGAAGEFQVPVDRVLGVRRLSRLALRRPPRFAQTAGGPRSDEVMGMVLDGERPVLIVDLAALSARARAGNRGT